MLSRDIYFPPFSTLAIHPSLATLPHLCIAANDLLSSIWKNQGVRYYCVDIRKDSALVAGTLPAGIQVEGKLWKNSLLLGGIFKCLEGVKNTHTICVMGYGHPEEKEEEAALIMECVR